MDRFDLDRVKKFATAVLFIAIALWVAWHGRTFNDDQMGMTTPVMCGLVALTFTFTGYRIVSRGEE